MSPRLVQVVALVGRVAGHATLGFVIALGAPVPGRGQSAERSTARFDVTGRQNLTLGSGARAYGMGGAFLARSDDATAASWNPAGLSYLIAPEVSLVGVFNSFRQERPAESDRFDGQAVDFAALAWPYGFGEVLGAAQLSYQRGISFDGRREIRELGDDFLLARMDVAHSDGGFDVLAFGTGLRLSNHFRAGFTVNEWFNGYTQTLTRTLYRMSNRPLREFQLEFRPRGWNLNLGLIWSPIEPLSIAAVYKTPFTMNVDLDQSRQDFWGTVGAVEEVTANAYHSDRTRLEFPASFGFGLSWRPRDALTASVDFTRTRWSEARILNYFDVLETGRTEGGVAAIPPAPSFKASLQYPTLEAPPTAADPAHSVQQDADQVRFGLEWVLIRGGIKVPLRAGYFSDRQIVPSAQGDAARLNGFTAGLGLVLGRVLLDVAYVYAFDRFVVARDAETEEQATLAGAQLRADYPSSTKRVFASVIYRFGHRP